MCQYANVPIIMWHVAIIQLIGAFSNQHIIKLLYYGEVYRIGAHPAA